VIRRLWNKIISWINDTSWLTEDTRPVNKHALIEPYPDNSEQEDTFNDLKASSGLMLDNMLAMADEIRRDIEYYESRKGITIQDRRHLRHLHQELDALETDIASLTSFNEQTFDYDT